MRPLLSYFFSYKDPLKISKDFVTMWFIVFVYVCLSSSVLLSFLWDGISSEDVEDVVY